MITISFVGLLVAIIAGTIVGQLIISLIEKRRQVLKCVWHKSPPRRRIVIVSVLKSMGGVNG